MTVCYFCRQWVTTDHLTAVQERIVVGDFKGGCHFNPVSICEQCRDQWRQYQKAIPYPSGCGDLWYDVPHWEELQQRWLVYCGQLHQYLDIGWDKPPPPDLIADSRLRREKTDAAEMESLKRSNPAYFKIVQAQQRYWNKIRPEDLSHCGVPWAGQYFCPYCLRLEQEPTSVMAHIAEGHQGKEVTYKTARDLSIAEMIQVFKNHGLSEEQSGNLYEHLQKFIDGNLLASREEVK